MKTRHRFSRREREVMDVVHRLRRASATEILAELADPPSNSAIRATLRILEEKGHLTHERDGMRYLYRPTEDRAVARSSALDHLVTTFFDGSTAHAVSGLLRSRGDDLSPEELDELSRLIQQARSEGR